MLVNYYNTWFDEQLQMLPSSLTKTSNKTILEPRFEEAYHASLDAARQTSIILQHKWDQGTICESLVRF